MTPPPATASVSVPRRIPASALVLFGLRGSGKSTVGQILAERLRYPFVDLDNLVLSSFPAQGSVGAVWDIFGEAVWRMRESEIALKQLQECETSPRVLAIGGGSAMIPTVRAQLVAAAQAGQIQLIYLRGTPAILAGRLRRMPGDRPPLTGAAELLAEITLIHAERDPVYQKLADQVFELAEAELPEDSADRIMQTLCGQ